MINDLPEKKTLSDKEDAGFKEVTVKIPHASSFIYANCAGVSVSQVDLRITFAETIPDGTAQARAGIALAPEFAAALAVMLLGQVRTYEDNFGKIRGELWEAAKAEALSFIAK